MSDIVWAEDCPGANYRKPKVKPERCGTCDHSEVTNAGAVLPGFHCKKLRAIFKDAGIEDGNSCVDRRFGICDHYVFWEDAERNRGAAMIRGAGI